uniref:Unspecified product n=1 Tax=Strongyloides stercoralis TaxID=6248 RepID=A0A0K0E3Q8_STRER
MYRSLFYITYILIINCINQILSNIYPPNYSPCQFPTPAKNKNEYYSQCVISPQISYICDLHKQLSYSSIVEINEMYEKHKKVFNKISSIDNKTISNSLAIVIVKQLLPPFSSKQVYSNHEEFGCLFQDECSYVMNAETIERFVNSYRVFTRIFASVLYKKWFPKYDKTDERYENNNCYMADVTDVLVLVVLDGMVGDNRKLPSVTIHTDNVMLAPFLSNIQLETTNAINQNWPLHQVISDLIDQLGLAIRSFYTTGGVLPRHGIPNWAYRLSLFCIIMVILALFIEWYIVRRKLAVKRNIISTKIESIKSKTHIMFGTN